MPLYAFAVVVATVVPAAAPALCGSSQQEDALQVLIQDLSTYAYPVSISSTYRQIINPNV